MVKKPIYWGQNPHVGDRDGVRERTHWGQNPYIGDRTHTLGTLMGSPTWVVPDRDGVRDRTENRDRNGVRDRPHTLGTETGSGTEPPNWGQSPVSPPHLPPSPGAWLSEHERARNLSPLHVAGSCSLWGCVRGEAGHEDPILTPHKPHKSPSFSPNPHHAAGAPGARRLLPQQPVVLLQPRHALQHLADVLQVPQPLPRHRRVHLGGEKKLQGCVGAEAPPCCSPLRCSPARTPAASGSSVLSSRGSPALVLRRLSCRCLLLRCCPGFLLAERLRKGRGGSAPRSPPGGLFGGSPWAGCWKPSREKLLSEPSGVEGEFSLLAISTPESSDSDLRSRPLAWGLPGAGKGWGGPQAPDSSLLIPAGGLRGLSCSRR